ncbi:hypothetical protein [Halovivax sp.]|uniref:DUF7546 family protein n=1 Tax=Halovivax sp. TaxID=1935978 RepID=UPI0025B8CE16|nr:hypothetical protein [Halovivax sp.]
MASLQGRSVDVHRPRVEILIGWGMLLAAQAALLAAYLTARNLSPGFFHLAPFIWINVGLWAAWRTSPPKAPRRRRRAAAAVAAGYFLLVGYVAGIYAVDPFGGIAHPASGFRFEAAYPPGYGPAAFYAGEYVQVALVPYLLVGYLSIAYLVYVTALDAARSAAGGVFGLVACIGCAWPLLAPVLAGVAGGGTALTSAVYANSSELSTLAFLAAIAVLTWRPLGRGDE